MRWPLLHAGGLCGNQSLLLTPGYLELLSWERSRKLGNGWDSIPNVLPAPLVLGQVSVTQGNVPQIFPDSQTGFWLEVTAEAGLAAPFGFASL